MTRECITIDFTDDHPVLDEKEEQINIILYNITSSFFQLFSLSLLILHVYCVTEAKIPGLMIWVNWIKPFLCILMDRLTPPLFKTKDVSFVSLSLSNTYIYRKKLKFFLLPTIFFKFRNGKTLYLAFHFSLGESVRDMGLFVSQ